VSDAVASTMLTWGSRWYWALSGIVSGEVTLTVTPIIGLS
jgi:hypothetical protein